MRHSIALFSLVVTVLLAIFSLAANDPGHDTLYIEQEGDSELNGSLNISFDLQVANRLFSTYLDIIGNGTITGSVNRILGTATSLYIENPTGDIILNGLVGTSNMVRIGDSSGDNVDLNVTGNIYVDAGGAINVSGVLVCLANGTNCVGGNNTGNVSSVTAGSGLTDSGTASDPVIDINLQANGGLQINSDALALNQSCTVDQILTSDGLGNWSCNDQTGGSADGTGGWTNTSTQTTTLFDVGINNTNPNASLHVVGTGNITGPLYANGSTVCTADNGLCSGSTPALQAVTDTGATTTNAITVDSDGNEQTNIANRFYVNGSSVGIGTAQANATFTTLGTSILANGAYQMGGLDYGNTTNTVNPTHQPGLIVTTNDGVPFTIPQNIVASRGIVGVLGAAGLFFEAETPVGILGYGVLNSSALNSGNAQAVGGAFYGEVEDGSSSGWIGNVYGVWARADSSTLVQSTGGKVYGVYSEITGTNNDTMYAGYFYPVSGGTQYGVYSVQGNNYFGGSVGINATIPNASLHVVGTGNITGPLYANGSTVCTADNGLCSGSTPALQAVTDTGATTTNAITVDSDGNEQTNIGGTLYVNGSSVGTRVGLGNTNPNATLDVTGESYFRRNQTYFIASGDAEVCFERFQGSTYNYTRCINSTGQVTERVGQFPLI